MNKVEFKSRKDATPLLKWLLSAAGRDVTRHNLRVLHFETDGCRITTTDGHRLHCVRNAAFEAEKSADISVDAIKLALNPPKVKVFGLDNAPKPKRGNDGPLILESDPPSGTFPDYRQVIGIDDPLATIYDLDPAKLIQLASAAGKDVSGTKILDLCVTSADGLEGSTPLADDPMKSSTFVNLGCRTYDVKKKGGAELRVNAKYLQDALRGFKSQASYEPGTVRMTIGDQILRLDQGDRLAIVMGMRR